MPPREPPSDDADRGPPTPPVTNSLLADDSGRNGVVQNFWLLATDGPDRGATFASRGERVVIGTSETADVVLHDTTVSSFHCEITLLGGRPFVRDMGSRNGTVLDGVAVVSAPLGTGATLTVGRTRLRFDLRPDPVLLPLSEHDHFGLLVGASPAMRRAFALLEGAAQSDATVLLTGETGTGKEAAAESLHRESARRDRPFVVVDCGAIPPDLLESELFGHERGAFTGAHGPREGAFEAAANGTIFLDEIGELAPELQPKLLRTLERREIKRVGSNRWLHVDARVIAATNRDLRTEVNARRFRADLYYRLAVLDVRLPSLRDRRDDLPALVEHLLAGLRRVDPARAERLRTPEMLAELTSHAWPGNVRELRNYIERCLAGYAPERPAPRPAGTSGDPELAVDTTRPLKEVRQEYLEAIERDYLVEILRRHGDNVTSAARAAGVDRSQFYRLMWRHGLR